MSRRRRWCTAALGLLVTVGLVGAIVRSHLPHSSTALARRSFSLQSGNLEFTSATHPFQRNSRGWFFPGPQPARLIIGPASVWRPSTSSATMNVGTVTGAAWTIRVQAIYVPLWPWALASAAVTAWLVRRARRVVAAGHCRACGYDLRALPGVLCPECGHDGVALFKRALRAWAGRAPLRSHLLALLAPRQAGRAPRADIIAHAS